MYSREYRARLRHRASKYRHLMPVVMLCLGAVLALTLYEIMLAQEASMLARAKNYELNKGEEGTEKRHHGGGDEEVEEYKELEDLGGSIDGASEVAEEEAGGGDTETQTAAGCRTSIVTGPAKLSNKDKPKLELRAEDPTCKFEMRLDGSSWVRLKGPVLQFKKSLSDGGHTIEARGISVSGARETNFPRIDWVLDSDPPRVYAIKTPPKVTNQQELIFEFLSTEDNVDFEYHVDQNEIGGVVKQWKQIGGGGDIKVNSKTQGGKAMTIIVSNVLEGDYRVHIRARDKARNFSPPTIIEFRVDLEPPDTIIHSGPKRISRVQDAAFIISAPFENIRDYTYEIRMDDEQDWQPGSRAHIVGTGFEFILKNLKAGPRWVEVRTIDRAGNIDPTPSRYEWTINMGAPETTIIKGPPRSAASSNATFTVTTSDMQFTYAYRLDGGRVMRPRGHRLISKDDTFTIEGITDGTHSIAVRATSVLGAEDPTPALYEWTVDTTPPEVTIISGPKQVEVKDNAKFTINASEPYIFQYRLNKQLWHNGHDGSPIKEGQHASISPKILSTTTFRLRGLSEGRHTLEVSAMDWLGNMGYSKPYTWAVDFGPPRTKIVSTPDSQSHARMASFQVAASEADCTFEYTLDHGGWKAIPKGDDGNGEFESQEKGSTTASFRINVKGGFHNIGIRARDATGNPDSKPASFEWVVY